MKNDWVQQSEVTEEIYNAPWGCNPRKYFRCAMCGHRLVIGDTYRIQHTNNLELKYCGNPKLCSKCDLGNNLKTIEKWKNFVDDFHKNFKDKFWWWVDS